MKKFSHSRGTNGAENSWLSAGYEKLKAKYDEAREELLSVYQQREQMRSSELKSHQRAQEFEKENSNLNERLKRMKDEIEAQRDVISNLNAVIDERDMSISSLQYELRALSLQYTVTEQKRQELQRERDELVERILTVKQQQADMQNEILSTISKAHHEKIAKQIQDASEDAHPGGVLALGHSTCNRYHATGGADHIVKVWDISGHNVASFSEHTGTVTAVDFSPSSETLVSCSNDKSVLIWSLKTKRSLFRCTGHTDKVYAVRYIGQSKLVSASQDRTLKSWNAVRGVSDRTYMLQSTCYDLAPIDGSRFLSCHFNKYICEWDTRQNSTKPVRQLKTEHTEPVSAVVVSPERNRALTSSKDGSLQLVDLSSMSLLKAFSSSTRTTSACRPSFSLDGYHFAIGRPSGEVEIWNIESGTIVSTLSSGCHGGQVTVVSWGRSQLVSAGKDGKLIVWEDDSLSD
eukprot:gene6509-7500_t